MLYERHQNCNQILFIIINMTNITTPLLGTGVFEPVCYLQTTRLNYPSACGVILGKYKFYTFIII